MFTVSALLLNCDPSYGVKNNEIYGKETKDTCFSQCFHCLCFLFVDFFSF